MRNFIKLCSDLIIFKTVIFEFIYNFNYSDNQLFINLSNR
jgi:hypothetical protein